jgi:type IV secretory pathway TrbD component
MILIVLAITTGALAGVLGLDAQTWLTHALLAFIFAYDIPMISSKLDKIDKGRR